MDGMMHGAGAHGAFDYVIVAITVVIVLFTLGFSIKYVVRPGEQEADHIKRIILSENRHGN